MPLGSRPIGDTAAVATSMHRYSIVKVRHWRDTGSALLVQRRCVYLTWNECKVWISVTVCGLADQPTCGPESRSRLIGQPAASRWTYNEPSRPVRQRSFYTTYHMLPDWLAPTDHAIHTWIVHVRVYIMLRSRVNPVCASLTGGTGGDRSRRTLTYRLHTFLLFFIRFHHGFTV